VGFLCLHRFLRKIRSGKVSDDLKTFWVNNKEKILTLLICGAVFTGALSFIALISGAVMKLFGFQYKSVGSVILFFIIATILSFLQPYFHRTAKGFIHTEKNQPANGTDALSDFGYSIHRLGIKICGRLYVLCFGYNALHCDNLLFAGSFGKR